MLNIYAEEIRNNMAMRLYCAEHSCDLQITVWLDEARKHTDVLHIFVTEGEDITVPLSATGHGSVVTCPEIVDGIDFGPEFTGMPCHVHAVHGSL